ncbi:MAG: NADPH-dependent 7-cyano-7-deazaguanine reductase QueF [Planctomycetes bacterium]|nr:NADPH-dependent 7-cyano-7-deazaguanine reductase QueF [Planctomycetota bacterium]
MGRDQPPLLETFPNPAPDRDYWIRIEAPEFTSVCPKTGLPDFGAIRVEYVPDGKCIELKAFKYYLISYRDQGIFYEAVVNRILDDLVAACRPRRMKVTGAFTARGGITTTVEAEHVARGAGNQEPRGGRAITPPVQPAKSRRGRREHRAASGRGRSNAV